MSLPIVKCNTAKASCGWFSLVTADHFAFTIGQADIKGFFRVAKNPFCITGKHRHKNCCFHNLFCF
jgi:hypothetical protein